MMTQEELTDKLRIIFGENNVISEWNVAKHSKDDLTRELYCPRIDIVVGPFNIDRNLDQNNALIQRAHEARRELIEAIKGRSDIRDEEFIPNENPRCLIAIELENKTERKHRIGNIVNASAIGRIGIIATNSEVEFGKMVKIRKYLDFLLAVGKTKYYPQNVMLIRAGDLADVLNQAIVEKKQN